MRNIINWIKANYKIIVAMLFYFTICLTLAAGFTLVKGKVWTIITFLGCIGFVILVIKFHQNKARLSDAIEEVNMSRQSLQEISTQFKHMTSLVTDFLTATSTVIDDFTKTITAQDKQQEATLNTLSKNNELLAEVYEFLKSMGKKNDE